jgi:hypothetical protein
MGTPGHKIPLAFFSYNRPEHTARALDALAACHRQDDFEFYFFSDGARNAEAQTGVAGVRHVLRANAKRFSAQIVERESNFGLAKSIVDGVGRLCESHGRVIVLEDDLIVAPDFLHYMASALDHYEDHPEVMQVGAYTIAPPRDRDTDAFLLPVTTTWGWGTWARAWKKFCWTPLGWPATRADAAWLSRFEINGAGSYTSMLEDRLAGRNDSWGILWWYAVSRNGGEVVYPSETLVWNGGFDGSGVHCGTGSALGQKDMPISMSSLPATISFPTRMRHRPEDFALLENVLRNQAGVPARVNSKLRFLFARAVETLKNGFN